MRYHIQSRRIFWMDLLARRLLEHNQRRCQRRTTRKNYVKRHSKSITNRTTTKSSKHHQSLMLFKMIGFDWQSLSIVWHFSFMFSFSSSWDFYISFRMLIRIRGGYEFLLNGYSFYQLINVNVTFIGTMRRYWLLACLLASSWMMSMNGSGGQLRRIRNEYICNDVDKKNL